MKQEIILFQFLGSDKLFSLKEVREMIKSNPDLLWIVFQSSRGSAQHDNGNKAPLRRLGQMDITTIEQKFG